MTFLKMYLVAFVVFLAVDAVWLTFVANKFYKEHLGFLMKETPNYVAALIFYLVFIVGLVYFVIQPGIDAQSISKIIIGGLLFGFITYATYDLTNLATVKDWPIIVTIVDLAWGSVLSTVISVATYYLYQLFW
ncbi:MAG: DUF2177 family protein [Bacilli bacterium]|nr:DUF2177 family protein [Bacilli bacterium]MBN2877203.1 DUF2177 family protein [Bacilli bacterium]